MGQNSKQRKAAQRRRQSERIRQRSARPSDPFSSNSTAGRSSSWSGRGLDDIGVTELVTWGARVSYGSEFDPHLREQIVARLVVATSTHGVAPDREIARCVVVLLGHQWSGGWLPLDLVHASRRELSPKASRMMAQLVLDDESLRSPDRPPEWDDQLAATEAVTAARFVGSVSGVERWRRAEKATLSDAIEVSLEVMGYLVTLPTIQVVLDPPSQWARAAALRASSGVRRSAGSVDVKVLDKVRALLAKAEGTDFPAEAEAFTAKAQELMSRHAIDAAMLSNERPHDLGAGVRSRRVHIGDPYAAEKAGLLGAVARSNSGRVVWDEQFGWATIVGFPVDLDLAELLFTSLLIQLTRAMADAGAGGGRAKSASFRRAFVLSYAQRIGERLRAAQQHARDDAQHEYGTSLVPVLAARTDAVDQITERIFPRLREMRVRTVDAQGWRAGRIAADVARLQSGSGMIDG